MERVTCNPLPYLKCNGSATVTSYCYFECNENVYQLPQKVTSYLTY